MADTQASGRRSSRIFTRMPVHATGNDVQGTAFQAQSLTIAINANGGLLYLDHSLVVGAELVLINPATQQKQPCRVVYLGDLSVRGTRVGVEFLSPTPHFWGIEFAQQDRSANARPLPKN
jgi:hypothetical protein